MTPSAGTKSEAAEPSEAAVEAGRAAYADWIPGTSKTLTILKAAMDPALGDDRLVVAGGERRRIVAEVVEALEQVLAERAKLTVDRNMDLGAFDPVHFVKTRFGGSP